MSPLEEPLIGMLSIHREAHRTTFDLTQLIFRGGHSYDVVILRIHISSRCPDSFLLEKVKLARLSLSHMVFSPTSLA